ncbi:hypothetical protein R3P38DRAFT_3275652, partial [Favolaschia claudopus]
MFSIKSLLFFTTAALFSSAAAQGWEVMVYEPSAGGSSSCTGGGTTISGSDVGDCHVVGLGSNAASFNVLVDQGPPGAEFVFNLFTDKPAQGPSSGLELASPALLVRATVTFVTSYALFQRANNINRRRRLFLAVCDRNDLPATCLFASN